MSWTLDLFFNETELNAKTTPPDNCYYLKKVISTTDPNNPYLRDITLEGYTEGDYIKILVMDYDCSIGNTGNITTPLGLYNTQQSHYAYVTVYDDKNERTVSETKSNAKVTDVV